LTGSHLCHNPRAMKEATALAKAGYDVQILGGWIDPLLKKRDQALMTSLPFRYLPVIDITANKTSRIATRIKGKLARIAHRIGHENVWQLGHASTALRRSAFRQQAELYIAHSEQAMSVAVDLLRAGRRAGVDMEDWFSEDLLPNSRRHRPLHLLRSLENELLTSGVYASCPSHCMSEAVAQEYRCAPPVVIYNAFHWSERKSIDGTLKDRKNQQVPSIHWFSQALGPGRGLEDLLAALPLVQNLAEIHLRGTPAASFEQWVLGRIPEVWRDRIFLHDLVSNEELPSRIAEHDIGFAGEMTYCRSRDLTVTNKILQYLLAGLAVIASDTTGQREVAERAPDAVLLYPSGDAPALAARIDTLLGRPEILQRRKAAALRAAEKLFCWERQEGVLLEAVARVLHRPSKQNFLTTRLASAWKQGSGRRNL
jgi:glycosyltransferase involved in cell wall biosynthesis